MSFIFILFLMVGIGSSCQENILEEDVLEDGIEQGAVKNANSCYCVDHVKGVLGITTSTADAKKWFSSYTPPSNKGWKVLDLKSGEMPLKGDIVVQQPAFPTPASQGHIAIVESSWWANNVRNIRVNESGKSIKLNAKNLISPQGGCNNVQWRDITISENQIKYIAFYRKK